MFAHPSHASRLPTTTLPEARIRSRQAGRGAWLVCAALTTLLGLGCGGASSGRASITPKSMPPGASFTGVWFSPQYGEMHMRQTGTAVIGEYSKDERSGRIQGNLTGNTLRFTWTERRELVQGRPSVNRGRGYFQLSIDGNGRENILGEWGIDDSEIGGGPWNGYKMKNRTPELSTERSGAGASGDGDAPDWGDTSGGGDASGAAEGSEALPD